MIEKMPIQLDFDFEGRPPLMFCFQEGFLEALKMNYRESTRVSRTGSALCEMT